MLYFEYRLFSHPIFYTDCPDIVLSTVVGTLLEQGRLYKEH